MDASPILVTGSIGIPLRGIKRKAISAAGESAKRPRGHRTPKDSGSLSNDSPRSTLTDRLGSSASDHDLEISSDFDEGHFIASNVTTPLTPISTKPSPRHPSDLLKIHCCTYEGCGKSFNRPAKLAQHLRSHTNTRPFVCPHALCTKDFLRESHLKHHVKSAHSDVRHHFCEWQDCGKSFVTATRLKRHHAAHEGRAKFRCIIAGCGQTFRKHGTLQRHTLTVHEGRKPFACGFLDLNGTECGADFDTEGQIKSHARRVHEIHTFLCILCSPDGQNGISNLVPDKREASFSTHRALQAHIESEHPPACTECGQECKSLRDLKNHLEVFHGGSDVHDSMTHFCREQGCGRGFTKKGILSRHIQICHNSKRFVYSGIEASTLSQIADQDGTNSYGKRLMTKTSLEEHKRSGHQGLVPSPRIKRQTKRVPDEPARKHQVSILTRLTGAGYEEESGRRIPCLVVGCSHRFLREYDLEIHLQSRHGLAHLGVRDMLMDQEGLYSRQTLQGTSVSVTKHVVDTEKGLGTHSNDHVGAIDHEEILRVAALKGGGLCPGAPSHHGRGDSGEWLRDEVEMRYLIDGGITMERHETVDGQEVDVIDPVLR